MIVIFAMKLLIIKFFFRELIQYFEMLISHCYNLIFVIINYFYECENRDFRYVCVVLINRDFEI